MLYMHLMLFAIVNLRKDTINLKLELYTDILSSRKLVNDIVSCRKAKAISYII